ncbi:hypothetical protein EI555_021151 [Monodon monoceros]|uniref:Centriole, cilia and spindle-associated protein n=1 Tax=Monodon monoceros TaxID=40151 RepID=A0A4U1EEE0_MONMO|nr:hypothetical protein EI555_021151 [Monodon monoceros]
MPVKDIKEKPERQIRTREPDKLPSSTEPQPPPSALPARGSRRAVKSPQRSSTKIKEPKHPFALYGWGEKQTDTGSQKTHNVCASAPVHEVGASERASLLSPCRMGDGLVSVIGCLVLLGLSPGVSLCEGLRTRQMRGPHIHESALRAKSRRQVEKRRLAAQRQRAHSADVDKNRRVKPASSENPWMTEYMRCYSARA